MAGIGSLENRHGRCRPSFTFWSIAMQKTSLGYSPESKNENGWLFASFPALQSSERMAILARCGIVHGGVK
jgi:hypothetical protein